MRASRSRWRWVLGLAMAGVLAVLAWRGIGRGGAAETAPPPVHAAAARVRPAVGLAAATGLPSVDERRRQLLDSVRMADQTYCNYLGASRYPTGSRPMAENPDQNRPNDPVTAVGPMRQDDGSANGNVQVQTAQSRVYLASGEAATFSLRAVDGDGNVLPLVVTRALAQGVTAGGARAAAQVAIPFADASGADPAGADGVFTGVLAPAQTGLAGFDGTIRTEVRYSVDGKGGLVQFDVIYSPTLPATWAGPVREAVEDGSLAYYLRLDVRLPGRYVVNGRVDDALGQPVALLTFNDVLGPGPQDIKLALFGKLLRDQAPAQPLVLRDVDGYLLKENTDPDRALLPRLAGTVFSGQGHAADDFSDAEWQGEERRRYLAEFAKDAREARARLAAVDPMAAPPPSDCAPATTHQGITP